MDMTNWPVGVKPEWSTYTPRGLHGPDFSHHRDWMREASVRDEHLERLYRMQVSNITVRTSSDSILEKFDGISTLEHLLRSNILPVVRINARFPQIVGDFLETVVRRCAIIGRKYGVERIPYILYNEPNDDREWRHQKAPRDWKEQAFDAILNGMWRVWNAGGSPGFPDPLGEWEWFFQRFCEEGCADMFAQHKWWVAAHLYNKDRPLNYPMDTINTSGYPLLSEQGHKEALGDFYDLWKNDPPLELINQQRKEWADPQAHWLLDHTCHGAWRNIRKAAMDVFGCEISIGNTEGGPTPKSPAGDGVLTSIDSRYVPYTPEKVAEVVIEIEECQSENELWCHNNWLYWSQAWAADSWLTGAYRGVDEKKYWLEMPAVMAYINNEYGGQPTVSPTGEALDNARVALDEIRIAEALLA